MTQEPSNLSLEEQEAEIRRDPVKWAYWKLKDPKGNPWKARWYQKRLIQDIQKGSRRLAVRMGRRVGKTETMVVFCLWYAFHHPNARLLIAAPYENQVRLIFMRLNEMIIGCEEISNDVTSNTKNPFMIGFSNGSQIMGFTIGANSGTQAGASIRGQRADWIFIDEVDYCDRGGIEAVTAIALADAKNIGIWCSSTPTGKRDFFYEVCTNPNTGYNAYHFPSSVNPSWDEMMEGEFRATMTEQAYIHEIEAEFGEETVGVFSKSAVEFAKSQFMYSYRELNIYERAQLEKNGVALDDIIYLGPYTKKRLAPNAIRIGGVDWDKYGAATQIVISEFDEALKKFRPSVRVEIPRSDMTFDNAVNKIIELNEIYDPKFWYIDRGFGEYQIEVLHKYGAENPESGLHRKVKGIHFRENIEIVDPGTRQVDKKDAKNFMINQTQILLDRGQILLSPFDDTIWKQMMNYQVVKISQTGKPQYTSENEHALDAFMLTMMGFTIEFPQIAKILEEVEVATRNIMIRTRIAERLNEKVFGGQRDVFQSNRPKREREARDNPNWHLNKVTVGYGKNRETSPWGRGGGSKYNSGRKSF